MKVVVSAVIFALVGVGIWWSVNKLPIIKQYSQCYELAILAMDDKGIITRRSHVTDEQICTERKTGMVTALNCMTQAQTDLGGSRQEITVYKNLARYLTRSSQTIEEMTADHNLACQYRKTGLSFDPITNQWY